MNSAEDAKESDFFADCTNEVDNHGAFNNLENDNTPISKPIKVGILRKSAGFLLDFILRLLTAFSSFGFNLHEMKSMIEN